MDKFCSLARQVSDANEDYWASLLADLETEADEGEDVKLDQREQAELEKTVAECERRLDEVQVAVQHRMWAQYVEAGIRTKFLEAEAACDRAYESPMCSKHLEQVTRLIQEASASLADWETWIPTRTTRRP